MDAKSELLEQSGSGIAATVIAATDIAATDNGQRFEANRVFRRVQKQCSSTDRTGATGAAQLFVWRKLRLFVEIV